MREEKAKQLISNCVPAALRMIDNDKPRHCGAAADAAGHVPPLPCRVATSQVQH